MKILSYILIALIVTVPGFWIKDYAVTSPILWTVLSAHLLGRLFGYLEGKKVKEDKTND